MLTQWYQIVVVQRELILRVKLWIYHWTSVPVLSCGPGLWVVVERMRWWLKLVSLAGLNL